jgi:DNA-binding winged helix-turn-helix (wHTH) protein
MRVRFGDCTLDTHSRELLREGTPVHLTGKAFRVLEVLIENRPNAVSKNDLQDQVWPDVFVSEGNLTSLVTELRNGLGDDARRPTFIRTVYGFGYAFCGEVAETGSTPATPKGSGVSRYRLVWGRKEIVLTEGENILGRGSESVEWFDRDTVSRRHARIVIAGETATIEDLGSKNGTYLRGQPVEAASPLEDGDQIRLGSVPLTLRMLATPGSTATKSRGRR